jgi:hypothetical protein
MVKLDITYTDHTKQTYVSSGLHILEGCLYISPATEPYTPTDIVPLYAVRHIALSPVKP